MFKFFKTIEEAVAHNNREIAKLRAAGHNDFADALQKVTDLQVAESKMGWRRIPMMPINFVRGMKAGYNLAKERHLAIQRERLGCIIRPFMNN